MGDVSIKIYDKFGSVLRIKSTCNDISTVRVKRKVGHRDDSSSEQNAPLKKYLQPVSAVYNHESRNLPVPGRSMTTAAREKLTKATEPVMEKGCSYRGLNFFAERDLEVLDAIGRGKYMTFRMQGKDIRLHLEKISPSAMSKIFKRLRLHGIIERVQGTYK